MQILANYIWMLMDERKTYNLFGKKCQNFASNYISVEQIIQVIQTFFRNPSCCNFSACALIYRQTTSALDDWKSHGATKTTSLSLIHILLFIFPLIRHTLTCPSVHLTTTLSPPTSLITLPSNCPSWGRTNSFRWDSLSTFLLPISKTYLYYPNEHVIKTYHFKGKTYDFNG